MAGKPIQVAPIQVAIIGAGIGGLTDAACLRRAGVDVTIYEQARAFTKDGMYRIYYCDFKMARLTFLSAERAV